MKGKGKGWHKHPREHAKARRGIKTKLQTGPASKWTYVHTGPKKPFVVKAHTTEDKAKKQILKDDDGFYYHPTSEEIIYWDKFENKAVKVSVDDDDSRRALREMMQNV